MNTTIVRWSDCTGEDRGGRAGRGPPAVTQLSKLTFLDPNSQDPPFTELVRELPDVYRIMPEGLR